MSSPSRTPKVLFFSTYISPQSGASYAMRETIRRVESLGIRTVVAVPECPNSRDMFPPNQRDTVYLKLRRPRMTRNPVTQLRYGAAFPSTLLALRKLIQERQIDIVHCNEITDFIAGIAAKWCGVPSVCHIRADSPPTPYRQALLWTLRTTTSAIAVPSKSTGAWIAAADRRLARRTKIVHDYAFDPEEYLAPAASDFRGELGLGEDTVLVVLVSKLLRMKGHLCFLRAAGKVAAVSANIVFAIVGGPVPGHEREADEIRGLARELGIEPRVHFLGRRFDLPAIYAACDIAVHCPVYPDPYPTVILLPMLKGKAVIGSDIGGIPEQIWPGESGLIVPPDDPEALGQAILRLAADAGERKRLGETAGRWIRREISPATQGARVAAMYDEVLYSCVRDAKPHAGSVAASSPTVR